MFLDTLAEEAVATAEAVTTVEEMETTVEEELEATVEEEMVATEEEGVATEEEVAMEEEVMVGTVEEGMHAKFGGGNPAPVRIQSSPQALSTGCSHPWCRGFHCFARPRASGQSARGPSYQTPPCAPEVAASIPVTIEKAIKPLTWVRKGANSARSTAPVPFLF